jgi:multiple sugar transport system substrate-binding protein
MQIRAIVLAAAIIMVPPGAPAADLVVWWQKGYYSQEDAALKEVVAAFEQETGKPVELVLYAMEELPDQIAVALEAGAPPDFAFGFWASDHIAEWAFEDRLVDLTDTVAPFSDLFDPNQVKHLVLLNATTGRKALYGLPMGQLTHLTHV